MSSVKANKSAEGALRKYFKAFVWHKYNVLLEIDKSCVCRRLLSKKIRFQII